MKPRDYCCCAIPLVNPGIYTVIAEQFVLGLVLGLLSFTTPSIVGAAVFSASSLIFGIMCLLGAGVQVLGFIAVKKQNMALFKRYASIHGIVLVAALAIAATWTVISGVRHNDAQKACIADFFADAEGSLKSQGETLCNAFAYADVGIMGGLIVLFLIAQSYFYFLMLAYPSSRNARVAQHDLPSTEKYPADTIPMYHTRDNVFPADHTRQEYKHLRRDSEISMNDVMTEPVQTSREGYSQRSYDADSYYPARPQYAYTEEPGPTPSFTNPYAAEGSGGHTELNRPADAKYHPAEGSFGRKTPRIEQQQQNPYAPTPYYS